MTRSIGAGTPTRGLQAGPVRRLRDGNAAPEKTEKPSLAELGQFDPRRKRSQLTGYISILMRLRMNAIYALVDPRDGQVRYVGRTVDPDKRLEEHWSSKTPLGTDKEAWLWALYEAERFPTMFVIDEVPDHAAKGHEHVWMARMLRASESLVNTTLPPALNADGSTNVERRITPNSGLDEEERIRAVLDAIRDNQDGDGAAHDEIIRRAEEEGMTAEEVDEVVKKLKNQRGTIYSPDGDHFKLVRA